MASESGSELRGMMVELLPQMHLQKEVGVMRALWVGRMWRVRRRRVMVVVREQREERRRRGRRIAPRCD